MQVGLELVSGRGKQHRRLREMEHAKLLAHTYICIKGSHILQYILELDEWTGSWGEPCIALQALHVQFLWQQPAASDCNQERQHTLANRSSLSAQVLGVLAMMHTTARADRKKLLAKKAQCRSKLEATA